MDDNYTEQKKLFFIKLSYYLLYNKKKMNIRFGFVLISGLYLAFINYLLFRNIWVIFTFFIDLVTEF